MGMVAGGGHCFCVLSVYGATSGSEGVAFVYDDNFPAHVGHAMLRF